jgi:hypothetical protein
MTMKGTHAMRPSVVVGMIASAAISAAIALSPHPVRAALQIAGTVNGSSFLCVDNTACDSDGAVGTLRLSNQTLAGVVVDGSIQSSFGTPGNPGPLDILNTSSLSVINTNAATVQALITVSDTSFAAPVTQATLSASGTWENAVGSSIAMSWYADTANGQGADFAGDNPGVLLDTAVSTAFLIADSLSHSASVPFSATAPFSMSETALITLTAGGTLLNRGQTALAAVETPEPSSLFILGGGIIALVLARTRALGKSPLGA